MPVELELIKGEVSRFWAALSRSIVADLCGCGETALLHLAAHDCPAAIGCSGNPAKSELWPRSARGRSILTSL